ncbi:sugar transferase [Flagellimonas beolgyonensis]|uniref:sugar transferase n=1 Tax=Flagellimonas beolgyonensis TaxID=864064 RepID=UPI000F8CF31C|nr:sugar transferase [Allomuricauda beolgyonensis]
MYQQYIKRTIDFLAAMIGLVFLLPVFLVISLLLALTMDGKVLFTQSRVGKGNKIFKVFKFKSMNDKRDANGELLANEERLTKLGRFIRSTSLDELPQLFNVIKGDMSFIGPRPLHVRYLDYYTEEEVKRHLVRPGITGLAQVSGRNALNWDNRLQLDVAYVNNVSLFEDMRILLLTVKKIFNTSEIKSEGIESLDEYRDRLLLEKEGSI